MWNDYVGGNALTTCIALGLLQYVFNLFYDYIKRLTYVVTIIINNIFSFPLAARLWLCR